MVNFFKYTDPLRIISLLILLIIFRLPFYIAGIPLTYPELDWLTIGEKLADGFTLYRDVWTSLEPLSAIVYSSLITLTGKSALTLRVSGTILVYLQAIFFNYMCNRMSLYNEKSSYPALFYILFSCLFLDFYSLPPVLLSLTFLLPAIYLTIIQIKYKTSDEGLLYLGLFLSLTALCYAASVILLPFFIFILLLFTTLSFRKVLLTLTGFLLPLCVLCLYHVYIGSFEDLIYNLFLSLTTLPTTHYTSYTLLFQVASLPLTLLLISFIAFSNRSGYINFQFNGVKSMLIILLGGICAILISHVVSPSLLYILVPSFAFFSAHVFLLISGKIIPNILLWLSLLATPFMNLIALNQKSPDTLKTLYLQPAADEPEITMEGKKVLVVGDEPAFYLRSKLATPYYDWELSKRHFNDFDNMKNIAALHRNFRKDLPEVIIDKENRMEQIFYRIPVLAKEYRKLDKKPVYLLKKGHGD